MGTLGRPQGRPQPLGSACRGHQPLPALGEPGRAGALQLEKNTGAIRAEWWGQDLGSNLNPSHVLAVLPCAGDLASLSLRFLICTMVLIIPRPGEFGNTGENNEYKARSTGMGAVGAQQARGIGECTDTWMDASPTEDSGWKLAD